MAAATVSGINKGALCVVECQCLLWYLWNLYLKAQIIIITFLKLPFCIECSIAGAHEKIAECKKQILQAKRIRKNRQGENDLKDFVQIFYSRVQFP